MKDQINNEKKLGRGLSALLGNGTKSKTPEASHNIISNNEIVELIEIDKLISGIYQPRKHFNHEDLVDLSKSIKENGVIQPVIVRKADEARGIYEIIAGERRFRASKLAGLDKIPAIVKYVSNNQALEFAIVENVQRADLSPIEEANSYKQLISEFNYTQEEVSKKIGHSRSRIANILRLLSLPKQVQDMIDKGQISSGHAKVLVGRSDAITLANKITQESLSVRDIEDLTSNGLVKKHRIKTSGKRDQNRQHFKALETDFSKTIGNLKVKINFDKKKEKGKVTIFYNDIAQIEKLIKKFGK